MGAGNSTISLQEGWGYVGEEAYGLLDVAACKG